MNLRERKTIMIKHNVPTNVDVISEFIWCVCVRVCVVCVRARDSVHPSPNAST